MLWRITYAGLKGRKKDTRLLVLAVTLSFLFLTLSTTVITSMDSTDRNQRSLLYGDWKVMAGGLSEAEAGRLSEIAPAVPMRILGTDDACGAVGVLSDGLVELGQFRLTEGHFPEKDDEVLLTQDQLLAMGKELHAGDTLKVSYPVQMTLSPEGKKNSRELTLAGQEANERNRRQVQEELRTSGELREACDGIWQGLAATRGGAKIPSLESLAENYDYCTDYWLKVAEQGWGGEADIPNYSHWGLDESAAGKHFAELTDAQQRQYVKACLEERLTDRYYEPMALDPAYYTSRMEFPAGDMRVEFEIQESPDTGAYGTGTAVICQTYTLAGVLQTDTDRWNTGGAQMPGLYVSEGRGELLDRALDAVLERYPYLERPEPAGCTLFFQDAERTPEELYLALMPVYNELIAERGACYDVDISMVPPETVLQTTKNEQGEVVTEEIAMSGDLGSFTIDFRLADDRTGEVIRCSQSLSEDQTEWKVTVSDPDTGEKLVTFPVTQEELDTGDFTVPGYHPLTSAPATEENMEEADRGALRINRYAYPLEESRAYLIRIVTVVLFLAAAAAVLQIFITQLRRRTRRIALLKAIGATNGQTAGMLFCEFLFYLAVSLPAGTGLGLVGAYLAVALMNRFSGAAKLLFTVRTEVLLLAAGTGVLALLAGMAVPGLAALRIPLAGRMEAPKRKAAVRRRARGEKRMSFQALIHRNLSVNRGRTLGSLWLSAFFCVTAVLGVCIGYASFDAYREGIEWADKPDYVLTVPSALRAQSYSKRAEALGEIAGISRADTISLGLGAKLMFPRMEESPLFREMESAAAALSEERKADVFGGGAGGNPAVETDVYAVNSDNPLFARLQEAAEEKADPAAFDAGDEVILVIPFFRIDEEADDTPAGDAVLAGAKEQDRMKLLLAEAGRVTLGTHDFQREAFSRELLLSPGGEVSLRGKTVGGTDEAFQTVRVGAVVYGFGDAGLWPVTEHQRPYTVVGSDAFLQKLYPESVVSYDEGLVANYDGGNNEIYYLDALGRTCFQLYTDASATREDTDLPVMEYAREHGMELDFYREKNQKEYAAARDNMLLAAFLGVASSVLLALILENAAASALEAERPRMGILQSMGVARGQFLWQQLYSGLLYALAGLSAAHAVWFLTACAFTFLLTGDAVVSAGSFFACMAGRALWRYPWGIHAAVCVGCAAACVLLQTSPMVPLLGKRPAENLAGR